MRALWTVARGWRYPGVVLVVTSRCERLAPIAEEIADAGLHGICATPAAVSEVFEVAIPDLVLLLADLSGPERSIVAARHAAEERQRGALVHLLPAHIDLVEIITDRLHLA